MDYNARYYDPGLGRWLSPDTIIPDPTNPQSLNRYSYVYNRPLVYIDDGGNFPFIPFLVVLGGVALLSTASNPLPPDQQPPDWVGLLGLGMLFGGGAWAAAPELIGAGATAACADGNCTNEAESVAKTICADGDCTNETQTVGKALDTACADGNCTNELQAGKQLINITEKGWRHVVERHTVNGLERYASKSKFSADVDVRALITQASSAPTLEQPNGYFVRIVDAGVNIGVDMTTGKLTTVYTVVTNAVNELVTAYPGTPLR
jgi:hypothetical protein